jgi:hypothetical protein
MKSVPGNIDCVMPCNELMICVAAPAGPQIGSVGVGPAPESVAAEPSAVEPSVAEPVPEPAVAALAESTLLATLPPHPGNVPSSVAPADAPARTMNARRPGEPGSLLLRLPCSLPRLTFLLRVAMNAS